MTFAFRTIGRILPANKFRSNFGVLSKKAYFLSVGVFFRRRGPASRQHLGGSEQEADPCEVTILFGPARVQPADLATGWAEDLDEIILRHCPVCDSDSIIGHGRRRKQAHDEHHEWIRIHRGLCVRCGKTFTFLPVFSLPYTHYSLVARCEALLRRFVEHCSWEKAVPKCMDSDCQQDPSTVRRWSTVMSPIRPYRDSAHVGSACEGKRRTVSQGSFVLALLTKIIHIDYLLVQTDETAFRHISAVRGCPRAPGPAGL